jgi:hypothetical protein
MKFSNLVFLLLIPLSTLFQYIVVMSCFSLWQLECLEKTTDLPPVTDKLYHIMLYRVHLATIGIRTHNARGDRQCLHMDTYTIDFRKIDRMCILNGIPVSLWVPSAHSIKSIIFCTVNIGCYHNGNIKHCWMCR